MQNQNEFPKPTKTIKGEPVWSEDDVMEYVMKRDALGGGATLNDEEKAAMELTDKAVRSVQDRIKAYRSLHDDWRALSGELFTTVKGTEQEIKKHSERMAQFMQRIAKDVRLEEVVKKADAIERIAKALKEISDLEKSGSLTKIGNLLTK